MNESAQAYWVYAIKNESTGRVYVGQAADIEERIRRHNLGQVVTTRVYSPWKLIAKELFNSRSEAMWRERELKRSRGKRLKWLMEYGVE